MQATYNANNGQLNFSINFVSIDLLFFFRYYRILRWISSINNFPIVTRDYHIFIILSIFFFLDRVQ